MNDELQLALTVMGIGIAVVALFELFFSKRARLRWRILLTPTTKLSDVGRRKWVKLVGIIRDTSRAHIAPVAKTKCIFYETSLDVSWNLFSRTDAETRRPIYEREGCDFVIDDRNGQALVELDLDAVDVLLKNNLRISATAVTKDFSAAAAEFLLSRGFDRGSFDGHNAVLCERFLAEGRKIAVLGEVSVDLSGGPALEKKPAVRIYAPPGGKLIIAAKK